MPASSATTDVQLCTRFDQPLTTPANLSSITLKLLHRAVIRFCFSARVAAWPTKASSI